MEGSSGGAVPQMPNKSTDDHQPIPHHYARRLHINKGLPSSKSKQAVGSSTPVPAPTWPPFPPPHVVLHPEDASSKVFLAIGRSFMSVVSALTLIAPTLICEPYAPPRTTAP